MTINYDLSIGTRVRIKGSPSGIELRASTGTMVRQGEMEGYDVVRLDEPSLVYDVPETDAEIDEIVESVENLEVVTSNERTSAAKAACRRE